jgi:hypothetical protein
MEGFMIRTLFFAASLAATASTVLLAQGTTKTVPEQFVGDWVCQTATPGYNLLLPSSDPSQPLTNKATTPPMVVVQKFSLRADGTYETPNAVGHYSFDPAKSTLAWLDGPHKAVTKTELRKRDNGEPTMGFVANGRYYGCFKPKPR